MKWNFSHELTKENFCHHEDLTLNYLSFEQELIDREEINFETLREVLFKKCRLNNVSFDNTFFGKLC